MSEHSDQVSGVRAANLGFPRMGAHRELKKALEGYWSGAASVGELEETASTLRAATWQAQHRLGIDHIPSGDFSFYDHVLDTAVMVGAVPDRYREPDGQVSLASYFAMARGGQINGSPVSALEMTKWFDTNYHYLVPELDLGQSFDGDPSRLLAHLAEAAALGVPTRPVLLGPLSFLLLARYRSGDSLALLPALVGAYEQVLAALAEAGASWVQIDEPALGLDLPDDLVSAYLPTYQRLAGAAPQLCLALSTYFTDLRRNLEPALALPIAALHLDLVAAPGQLEAALAAAPENLALSLGVVDGRNVWRSDLAGVLGRLESVRDRIGAHRLIVAPSCSLLHLPVDVDLETGLDSELRSWMAFAAQRLEEISLLKRGLVEGRDAIEGELADSRKAVAARAGSARVHNPDVAARLRSTGRSLERRQSPYPARRLRQAEHGALPPLPTTTIGSLPQTADVRAERARYKRGQLDAAAYEEAMQAHIGEAVRVQEEIGLDVLVHGEFERNDMVEYFGEHLEGYTVTDNGWVQSYGSRCVKPPIIFGDVSRPMPITLKWTSYAQSLTAKPVKGMLTGPVTMLQWSFVRDDQPLADTCRQLALAIRDEVTDLEAAGVQVIQIDEPALREGLPLHVADRAEYLAWATAAFRLSASGVADETQIHTHMCYGNFEDIIDSIIDLDADVISIEAARSGMDLLSTFQKMEYPNEIGPGVWDIHSPRVPDQEEMTSLLVAALDVFPSERLWVNPDCGLKTRRWEEVRPALTNLVAAASTIRQRLAPHD